MHEVFLRVESQASILGKISNLMGERNVDILGIHGQVSEDKGSADLIFYVEMKDAKATIEEVVAALRAREFVLEARSWPMKRLYFERATFSLTSGGHYRVLTVGAASWVSLLKAVVRKYGSAGRAILHEEGVAAGEEMVERIRRRLPEADQDTMLENLKGLIRASGFGILQIERTRPPLPGGAEGFNATLTSTAAAESADQLVDDFLVGAVRGALGKISSKSFRAEGPTLKDGRLEFKLVEA